MIIIDVADSGGMIIVSILFKMRTVLHFSGMMKSRREGMKIKSKIKSTLEREREKNINIKYLLKCVSFCLSVLILDGLID